MTRWHIRYDMQRNQTTLLIVGPKGGIRKRFDASNPMNLFGFILANPQDFA